MILHWIIVPIKLLNYALFPLTYLYIVEYKNPAYARTGGGGLSQRVRKRTRGGGGKNPEIFAYVLNGWLLNIYILVQYPIKLFKMLNIVIL